LTKITSIKLNPWYSMVSGMVYTRVEVCKMDLELYRLVEQPWLQLMSVCCIVATLDDREKSEMGVSADLVCHC